MQQKLNMKESIGVKLNGQTVQSKTDDNEKIIALLRKIQERVKGYVEAETYNDRKCEDDITGS